MNGCLFDEVAMVSVDLEHFEKVGFFSFPCYGYCVSGKEGFKHRFVYVILGYHSAPHQNVWTSHRQRYLVSAGGGRICQEKVSYCPELNSGKGVFLVIRGNKKASHL